MTELQLRNRLGMAIVSVHFLLIGVVIVLFFAGGFLFPEMTTTVALLVPIFASYTTAVVRETLKTKVAAPDTSETLSPQFVRLSWFTLVVFSLFLVAIILCKALHIGFANFEEFKILLAIGETAFGVYLGMFVKSLYG
jgi:hypothetical protein